MTRTLTNLAPPFGFAAAAAVVLLIQGARPGAAFGMLLVVAALLGGTLVSMLRAAQALTGIATSFHQGPRDARWKRELTREKALTLRSLRDLEFDHAMGKLSDRDFQETSARLRARAVRIMRELDERPDYTGRIERELEARLARSQEARERVCSSCSTNNDQDATFCKTCGQRLNTP